MAKKLYEETDIQKIADAIRAKSGKTGKMKVVEMSEEIGNVFSMDQYLNGDLSSNIVDIVAVRTPPYCFYQYTNLESFVGEKVMSINVGSFSASSIKWAKFPTVYNIWGAAFQSCKSLTALIFSGSTMVTNRSAYVATSSPIRDGGTGYIYVPSALIDKYKTATNWVAMADQFRVLEDYTVDGTITGALDESKI